jgi:tetratricopeptide (TPR) repeat protein
MKHILLSSLCAAVVLLSQSCNSILDVQPQLTVSYNQSLSTTRGLDLAINGAYSLFADGSLAAGNLGIISEILADHTNFQGGDAFGFGQIVVRQVELVNTVGRSTWENAYNVINRLNLVNDALQSGTVQDITLAANRNRIEGEVRFLRALTHFELVRIYALPWGTTADNSHPGIPYRTQGTQGPQNATTKRAPVAEVYNQIAADLQAAARLLPQTAKLGKPSALAARAALARVYLQQERYAEAFTEADAVIQANVYSLNANVRDVWVMPSTPEVIMELPSVQDIQDAAGGYRGNFSADLGGGAAALAASDSFLALLRASRNDRRQSLFTESLGRTYTNRFDVLWSNYPLIRIAEMYLIRAEAGLRTSRSIDQVRADLNRTRVRAGLAAADIQTLSGDALQQAIQTERALELVFQGNRLHDLRRWRQPVPSGTNPTTAALQWNDPRLVMPRPDREVSVNPD